MSIKEYLKDHGVCILIFLICMGITEGIFLLFNLSMTLQIFVLTVLFLGFLAAGIYGYNRKKGFYRELEQKLQQLEEKYLLMEMLEKPDLTVLFLGFLAAGIYGYNRKKGFYRELEQKLQQLEEKYLLMEMLEKPEFLEGQILYDVVSEMQKSMNDEIFVQIRKNNEFKRYIETWVHEVKLPIASIRLILHEYKGTSARTLKEQVGRIEGYVEQVLYYLRSEVPEEFLEGQILYDVVSEMQKSMNDEIFVQIRKNNEFKRYIETWVHEVKLPIASIRLILHEYKGTLARTLKEQMGRIESYVEQVLYYLRSEVPEKDYRIAPHSLKKLTDQSVSENRDSLILNRIKIIQETQDIFVYTDEKWLRCTQMKSGCGLFWGRLSAMQ